MASEIKEIDTSSLMAMLDTAEQYLIDNEPIENIYSSIYSEIQGFSKINAVLVFSIEDGTARPVSKYSFISAGISQDIFNVIINDENTYSKEYLNARYLRKLEEDDIKLFSRILDFLPLGEVFARPLFSENRLIGHLLVHKKDSQICNTEQLVFKIIALQLVNRHGISMKRKEIKRKIDTFTLFANSVSDGILITENYKPIFVNDRFCEIYCITKDFFEEGDLKQWGFIDLIDIDSYIKYHDSGEHKLYEIENWFSVSDGTKKYLIKKFYDIRDCDTNIINYLIITDLTEKKKAETDLRDNQEKFRLISELTTDCSYAFTVNELAKLKFELCSGSYKDLFGIPLRHKEFDTLWDKSIFDADGEKLLFRMSNLLQGRKDISEYRVYDRMGNVRWIRDYGVPVFDSFENRVTRIIGAATDITEEKNSEQTLLKFTDELKHINISKDKFFSIVSHDMKNPIMGFKNLTELLVEDYNSMNEQEILEILIAMKQSSANLFRMFEDIIQWSKAQMGRIQINKYEYDLSSVVFDVINHLKVSAKEKDIKLINKIKLGSNAVFDLDTITLILRNLISNAIKFSYIGGEVIISANFDTVYNDKEYVEIEVRDKGVGINEENLIKLFRIEAGFTTLGTASEKGTGLGLILCKEFVQLNGGMIWASSKLNEGASFKFTIPK